MVERYDKSTIPLQILSMIGYIKNEISWSDGDAYIIGRWGDELESFPELKKKALDRYTKSAEAEIKLMISRLSMGDLSAALEVGLCKNQSVEDTVRHLSLGYTI